ncbi:putative acyltransferase [Neolecta irregularis DAH-3]|uniref:Putative acyltransferase n=1 Tax=Neolecta irregularis (strain DAH-3) TaxID=1198029 RepID=A0A1U7LWG3_NEOID|nr:putative acyltransferase [Neolecta irregularis DAH-3]|eukprot:OLL27007.1 putative acyltransferase [Neolecta irregularis DAH-3]
MEHSSPVTVVRNSKSHTAWEILRFLSVNLWILSSSLIIVSTQVIGAPLHFCKKDWYYAHIARTKAAFGIVLIVATQWFAPAPVYISGDKSVRGQLHRSKDGRLETSFPERIIMISNHQIYTDWLYIWWISYTSKMHQAIYIVLKDSLKWIPVLGWGMQMYGFIFMRRKWEQDKPNLSKRLSELSASRNYPMWLLLYPEGTVHASNTVQMSAEYAKKKGIKDLRYLLLPRSTGLRFCIQNLFPSIDYVYDCTIGYEGNPPGSYAQDIFDLRTIYGEGKGPIGVHMHFRRYLVSDIPYDNEVAFEDWLLKRWKEKEEMLDYFYTNGHFHSDVDVVKTQAKLESLLEIFDIFNGLLAFILVSYLASKIAREFLGLW